MTASPSENPSPSNASNGSPVALKRQRGFLERVFLWLLFVVVALSVPPVFRAAVWALLHEEVWRQGGYVSSVQVQGSLWQPIQLNRLKVSLPRTDGGVVVLEAAEMAAEFQWKALFDGVGNRRFFERLRLRGGRLIWARGGPVSKSGPVPSLGYSHSFGKPLALPMPSWLDLEFDSVGVISGKMALQAEKVGLSLSELAPGEFTASKIDVTLNSWVKSLRGLRGKTSLQGGRVQLGETVLSEGLRISALSASLTQLAAGRVDFELQAEAFGGELRVLAQSNSASVETPFEASGTFSKLGVAPLAAFLNVTEAAGGTLEAGKFSFRGRPSHPEAGTASLRLEAKNFQWESRQWDALVLGATLLDHRIKVPEFSLRQGHNQLVLNGDMQWPGGDIPWWKADFGVNVSAQIDNLTELSALVLPEFKYAAGGLTVDGAVRSQAGIFGGALIVSGSNLTWRNAPIDELHAALKLQGAEIQLLNVQLTRGADFLRGKGALNVGEDWHYRGELHGKVRDISKYAAFIQPSVATQPYSGGVDLDWSGNGSAKDHVGNVRTQFERLLPVRAQGSWAHPMSGGFSATYGKDGVEVENASLGDSLVQVRTNASFGAMGAKLTNFSVSQENVSALEGEGLLPPEIWKAWPQVDWDVVLKSVAPLQARFVSKNLNLSLMGRLPGMPAGLEGFLEGNWEMAGTLANLEGKGTLSLRDAAWAMGATRITGVGASIAWGDRDIRVTNLGWRFDSGLYKGEGTVSWKGDRSPQLQFSATCDQAQWRAPLGFQFPVGTYAGELAVPLSPVFFNGRAEWNVSGGLDAPLLAGKIVLRDMDFGGVPDLRLFWKTLEPKYFAMRGQEFRLMSDWKLQLEVGSAEGATVTGTTGAARVDLKATGTVGKPEWLGEVRLALRGSAAGVLLEVEPLVVKFSAKDSAPEVEIRAHGTAEQGAFRVTLLGPLGSPVREYQADAPLLPETVRGVFEEAKSW